MSDGVGRPRFITFDCYGTLTNFAMTALTRDRFAGRLPADRLEDSLVDFAAYRLDQVLGPYQPYAQVITESLHRATGRWGMSFDVADARALVEAVPTWGPHPDVPVALARLAEHYPLVILSNAAQDQIGSNVAKLGAPFHAVYTAEQARAYKPRFAAFEFLLDQLGCGPDEILHVSSSLRYDLMPAHDLRITNTVYLNRGYEPSVPYYGYREVASLGEVADLLGC